MQSTNDRMMVNITISRFWIPISIFCALIAAFIIVSAEVREADAGQKELIGTIDKLVSERLIAGRTADLNSAAIDLTAMGSGTVLVVLISFFSICWLLGQRFVSELKYNYILQLWISAIGSGVLTWLLKSYFERSRPPVELHLVNVQSYSYPSGHSLASAAVYFSIALVLRRLPFVTEGKVAIFVFTTGLVAFIGVTRIYLGVHYFSDVAAGILIGASWALIADVAFSVMSRRKPGETSI